MKNKNEKIVVLLGKKLGMTQLSDSKGAFVAVTALEVGPCPIIRVKSAERDGYGAVQIGADPLQNSWRSGKAWRGNFEKYGQVPHRYLREFRVADAAAYAPGEILNVVMLKEGEQVDIQGITKGRGFQGVVKRHGFSGGPGGHGSMFHRRGGSYGMREEPGRVYKGRKMPGHMGAVTRTIQNLEIVKICADEGVLFVKGSVVGPNGNWVSIRTARKGK
ncbi:MAG: 50S ribosomal protein L3 [Puniceicoccales bacterium]|jgi:large subunit ribosomal protein L3|nr:50S ribosomal protein L3 [Puniceicoccales bacterium]